MQSRCCDVCGIYLYHEESTKALDFMKMHRCKLVAEFISLYNDIRLCIKKSLIKVYFSSNWKKMDLTSLCACLKQITPIIVNNINLWHIPLMLYMSMPLKILCQENELCYYYSPLTWRNYSTVLIMWNSFTWLLPVLQDQNLVLSLILSWNLQYLFKNKEKHCR